MNLIKYSDAARRLACSLRAAARAPLAWFTEGFDTADLKDAKALLDELASICQFGHYALFKMRQRFSRRPKARCELLGAAGH